MRKVIATAVLAHFVYWIWGRSMGNDGSGSLQLSLLRLWQLIRDEEVVPVAWRQQRLITALAISGPRPRGYLAGLLWPDKPEPKALESLRVSLHLVSRQVPGLLINGGRVLSLNKAVEVDLHRIRSLLLQLRRGELDGSGSSCIDQLRDAELLPGWYDDWLLFEQSRWRQERIDAFQVIARESLTRGDFETALEASGAALELEPLYESAVGLYIQAHRQQGNNASALCAFEKYEAKLKEEMGLIPSEAIRRLIANERSLGAPAPREGTRLA